ncbi:MAG: hypothetical protein IT376_04530 [Polyangiaceae bacterium]|nr:hypothetical protein [Polyangiaceae bacterium]
MKGLSRLLAEAGLVSFLGALLSCGPPEPPPRTPRARARAAAPPQGPDSAEWLFATEGVRGGRVAECERVFEVLQGEASCKHALCRRAERLASDWLRACRQAPAEQSEQVRQLSVDAAERATTPATPCEEEVLELLRTGCPRKGSCQAIAQSWATRCGATEGTPLVLRMLEVAVERSRDGAGRVRLDPRSCDQLQGAVVEAARCTDTSACEAGLEAVATFEDRCGEAGAPPPLAIALARAKLRDGAGHDVPPTPVTRAPLTGALAGLPLADGSGAVFRACDATPVNVGEYVQARAACADGVVVVARVFGAGEEARLRLARIPHPGDEVFRARYSALAVGGEAELREQEAARALLRDLDAAIVAAPAAGAALVVEALARHAGALRRWEGARAALAARDGRLEPIFSELGRRKHAWLGPALRPNVRPAAIRRSLAHPLADLDAAARPALGAATAAAALPLARLTPRAMAAYLEQLERRSDEVERLAFPRRERAALEAALARHTAACAEALSSADATERRLLDCAFAVVECDEPTLAALGPSLDTERGRAEAERVSALLAASGLGGDTASDVESTLAAADCQEPWW